MLVTEPLTAGQLERSAGRSRQGVGDSGNQFHYYRLTDDDRLLWGGYDALYYFGGDMSGRRATQRRRTAALLAEHLLQTFPPLDGVRVTHALGRRDRHLHPVQRLLGADPRRPGGYGAGFTGLGVGCQPVRRAGLLDLLAGRENERTALEMVRRKPLPFPPEPARWAGIQLTRRAIARADRRRAAAARGCARSTGSASASTPEPRVLVVLT